MKDGYPTDEELETISKWEMPDFYGLMEYIEDIWMYADCGYWKQDGKRFDISTGGWSGNEEIIQAMQKNYVFWCICWFQSRRGGHYIFEMPRVANEN